jgi:type IV pilus assembly protein PilV
MSTHPVAPLRCATARRRGQRGASLVEVLIALLVISLGLLGMARLGSAAIGHTKSSQVRAVAQGLAQSYAERARLNLYGFDLGAYDIALGAAIPQAQALDVDADDLPAATAVAAQDQREFLQSLGSALPAARAIVVSRPSATARDMDVWLLWPDVAIDANDSLTQASVASCPANLTAGQRAGNSCMHFRVGL